MSKQAGGDGQAETQEPSVLEARLNWRLAWRDDERVAQAIYAGEEIEEIHGLSDAGLLDEFFVYWSRSE